MALSVPLSRFTSRVGGGSAFFVRRQDHTTNQQHKMKSINTSLVVFGIALAVCGRIIAQPAISMSSDSSGKTRTFLGGTISISGDIQTIETNSFTCTPVQPFKKGDKVAAMVSDDQAWSVDKMPLQVGTSQVQYPILAMVKCSGDFHIIFPAVLKAKIDIKAGGALKADGYQIEAKRAVKAGESISVLLIDDSLLSVEASDAKPWFTAYKDDTKPSDRAALVEAWKVENERAGK